MHRHPLIPIASLALLLSAAPAGATVLNTSSTPTPRLFVDGMGGVTFNHNTDGLFAGAVSVSAGRHLQIEGEVGRMVSVLPNSVSQNLDATAAGFETTGMPAINYAVTMPATYGLGMVRAIASPMRGIEPFVEGGFGAARVTTSITAQQGGTNIAPELSQAANLLADQTRPLVAVGGGLSIAAGGTAWVDVGYRYSRIFTTAPAINVNRVYAGIRFGF
jgi:opacity protein-like surface antigen